MITVPLLNTFNQPATFLSHQPSRQSPNHQACQADPPDNNVKPPTNPRAIFL